MMRLLAVVVLVLTVGGCAALQDYNEEWMWHRLEHRNVLEGFEGRKEKSARVGNIRAEDLKANGYGEVPPAP